MYFLFLYLTLLAATFGEDSTLALLAVTFGQNSRTTNYALTAINLNLGQ